MTNLSLMERVKAPTPKWFRYIRNAGIMLTAVSTAIATMGIGLPPIMITISTYCAVGGAVATAVAQTAVDTE